MSDLPLALYRAEQVRELDRVAIQEYGIPGAVLMERAGSAAFGVLRQRWPQARAITLLCGIGNNGGDGFVVARRARETGLDVRVLQLGDASRLHGDALSAARALQAAGVEIHPWKNQRLDGVDVIVDALLGTGLEREVSGTWREAIEAVNAGAARVLALDIPSGLHADSGAALGAAVRADVTVTFIGLKQGLFTGAGPDHCGAVVFNDLQVPVEIYSRVAPGAVRIGHEDLMAALRPRPRTAHKGHYGHVLVIGGEHGMAGAARLAAEAAARVGAGLVSVATRAAHAVAIAA
ncbi:MAG: NAD(P)H-hydrate epimerase, partial [Gammaproteobacteria bacterium]|nr:NAD(P)H-hydrate epimerase [Gammaproteobacteria bacterium]